MEKKGKEAGRDAQKRLRNRDIYGEREKAKQKGKSHLRTRTWLPVFEKM